MHESRLTAELRAQNKRIFNGGVLLMVSLLLLGVLRAPSIIIRVTGVGGCLIICGLMLRYFYYLLLKKDE